MTSSLKRMSLVAGGCGIAAPDAAIGAPRPLAERPSKAGLLAPGSQRLPAFPAACKQVGQWHVEQELPGHSCGGSARLELASLLGPISRATHDDGPRISRHLAVAQAPLR